MIKRATVRLPEDLLNQARRKAPAERRSLSLLVEDGGGLMPGIDLTNPRMLQEAEDLEYIRRPERSQ